MKYIIVLTMLFALVLPLKAKAMQADRQLHHWSQQRQIHINAKRWIKLHPDGFTYKRWTHLLKKHTSAIRFATQKITFWRYQTTPPNESAWLCIHRYEGSWTDSGDPYWGGLQMDRGFMKSYAPVFLLRRGWANRWTPNEQMWVAERARESGRGFYPWPNTARVCRLI